MENNTKNLDFILEKLLKIDVFLKEEGRFKNLKVCADNTTRTTYMVDDYYITIWYDANNYPYSVEIHLRANSALSGVIFNSEIIASSCPFDQIQF